uniref:Uncharacterized protein n=1 Tax=Brassica oleracea var. oleracea TaxID=109376 RepID=A0A0D3EAE4_BRAOL
MYALHGLRSVAVARQTVPENQQIKSSGGPWEFVGGLPLFDPPLHDSAYTIRRASDIGVNINDHCPGATDRKRWKSFKARQKRNVLLPLGATRQMSRASFTEIHKYCYTEPFTF